MTTYHYVWVPQAGAPDVLEWCSGTLPAPGPQQVQVRVEASGMLYGDLRLRNGQSRPGAPQAPYSAGHEVVGMVEAVGSAVDSLTVGQRVAAVTYDGAHATHALVKAWRCIPITQHVAATKAVCALINYWTAYRGLYHVTKLSQGDRILLHGAGGGVGTAVLDLAQSLGLVVYATASAAKHERLAAYDVVLIDYKTTDFVQRIREWVPEGVAAAFDPIDGTNWRRSYRCLKEGGRLVIYGFMGNNFTTLVPSVIEMVVRALLPDGKSVRNYRLNTETMQTDYRESITQLQQMLADGKIDPMIDRIYPMDEIVQAHERWEAGLVTGKIVLVPPS